MQRIKLDRIRENWQSKVEDLGFYFHEIDGLPYWDESVFYKFTSDQIDHLEEVTDELNRMCKNLVEHVFYNNLSARLAIPEPFFEYAKESWRVSEPSVYGRFDLWWDGRSEPKLLEFNADTPTALFEASVIQYYWLQDMFPSMDQFNSIHEKLLDVLGGKIRRFAGYETLYTSSVRDSLEDFTTTEYIRDVAIQAGLKTEHIFIDDIGYDNENGCFVDLDNNRIRCMFKLYPWEWLIREEFGPHLLEKSMALLEPAWKMVLSNKAILPVLWEMYPGHKNLLPSYFEPRENGVVYVEKPYFSREGENIIVSDRFSGGKPEVVYQEYRQLPDFQGSFPVIGSWVVGSEPAGIGIREDTNPITNNLSRFVPHLFDG